MAALFELTRLISTIFKRNQRHAVIYCTTEKPLVQERKGEDRHLGDMAQLRNSSPYLGRIDGFRVSREHLQLRVELMKRNVRGRNHHI